MKLFHQYFSIRLIVTTVPILNDSTWSALNKQTNKKKIHKRTAMGVNEIIQIPFRIIFCFIQGCQSVHPYFSLFSMTGLPTFLINVLCVRCCYFCSKSCISLTLLTCLCLTVCTCITTGRCRLLDRLHLIWI